MKAEVEDFGTGWYGVHLGLKENEIDSLIDTLQRLKDKKTHFHYRSEMNGNGGLADIEIYFRRAEEPSNMELEASVEEYRHE